MGCLGNIIGVLWSITIVGIPIDQQCLKLATLAFFPFGKDVQYGGNIVALFNGLLLCCTIIGAPFGTKIVYT